MISSERRFGEVDGKEVSAFTVENSSGYAFTVISYGAILTSFIAPDRSGASSEITLGYESLDRYLAKHPFFGSTVGRVANRIGGARFSHDGTSYTLDANEGGNTLHGGGTGFDKKFWDGRLFERSGQAGVVLHMVSPDGDQGFPGQVAVTATYILTDANELIIEYQAETDAETPVNLTNHTYWNLAGAPDLRRAAGESVPPGTHEGGAVGDHTVTILAKAYLEQGAGQIPTGRLPDTPGTPYDFLSPKTIGADIDAAGGYDLCYVLEPCDEELCPAATISESGSGRRMDVVTTYPALQFYTGEKLEGTAGRKGQTLKRRDAFCVETQYHPDAVNHDNFPSIILKPDETYQHRTVHRFSVE
jgi:aldose 1-epimerase